jgi:DoxX-like family
MANSISSSSLSKEAIVTSEKKAKWIYWALTAPLILMIGAGGLGLLAGSALNVEGITHLGYPVYLCKILGTAKLLGVIAILYGRFETLKEWAYAGFTFNLIGASASHAFSGDSLGKIITPVIILGFVLASYRVWKNALDVREGA